MRSPRLLRAAVLLLFVSLIAFFVAYRSGVLEKEREQKVVTSDPAEAYNTSNSIAYNESDTVPIKANDSTVPILSTSKSFILTDEQMKKRKLWQDSVNATNRKDSLSTTKTIISSSKSSAVFTSKAMKRKYRNWLKKQPDSLKKKNK